jgi:quercetin dioxygenase-like cupin family protein
MEMTRRNACAVLSSMFLPAILSLDASVQEGQAPPAAMLSAMFPFEKLPVRSSNGIESRAVLKGKLVTRESVEVHETTLPPGSAPHPPHRHLHSEMWLVREGTIEITVNGSVSQLDPGSVGFVRSNDEHGIKNAGATPAAYFVVAIGPTAA